MRRWNGWGDDTIDYPLPETAAAWLDEQIGTGTPPVDARLEDVLSRIPQTRLPSHPLVDSDPVTRLQHARGQSLPDWIALRSGQIDNYPDGVAFPTSTDQVCDLLRFARTNNSWVIPYGGGTSVVGHINPPLEKTPILTVNLSRMNRLLNFDEQSLLATFEAGIAGPDLEAKLRAHGCTLGHYPQSFEYSTLGGWIASRSSGQQSLRYGRIEKLFAGGWLESPEGGLELPSFPASAAGPDLREVVLGSEGRLGIITEATVRISRLPEQEYFHAIFFPDFPSGQAAVRQMLQEGLPLSMLRLSTAVETTTTLALAGHAQLIGAMQKLLQVRGLGTEKCLLLIGFTGRSDLMRTSRQVAFQIASHLKGVHIGKTFGNQWQKSRFRTPYLRNTLWERGYAIDTLETAVAWPIIPELITAIESELKNAIADTGERLHVFTHLSHIYPHGSSIYTTFVFRLAPDPQENYRRWLALKTSASRAIVRLGGTISHQHGIGTDHRVYLPAEKGELGMAAIQKISQLFDPHGMMNPGKLF
jgi:alkyldihydroxyacetonephosphate synthase